MKKEVKKKIEIKTPEEYGFYASELEMDYESPSNLEAELPFELKAEDFINFAELDIKKNSIKHVISALGNIKRALENRMDCLLYIFGYSTSQKKWDFPKKIAKLNELSIIAPGILAKINKIRNMLEHKYKIPKKEKVEDALDITILFLEYTKYFIKNFKVDFHYFKEEADFSKGCWIDFEFKKQRIKVSLVELSKKKKAKEKKFYIDATNPHYDAWVKFIIKLVY